MQVLGCGCRAFAKSARGYEYLTTPIDAQGKVLLSLEQVIKAQFCQRVAATVCQDAPRAISAFDLIEHAIALPQPVMVYC